MPAAAAVRKGVPCLRLHGRVRTSQLLSSEDIAVLAQTRLCQGCASQRLSEAGLLRQGSSEGGSGDALMVGLAR